MRNLKLKDIIQAIVVVIVLWGLFFNKEDTALEMKEYWENKDFKTDTVRVDVDYSKIPKPVFKYEVPPARVYNYYSKDSSVISNISLVMDDSLLFVIDSLQEKITSISLDYLKLYPNASKFIYGTFSHDSITFNLLRIDGSLQTLSYGTNYQRFRYQYNGGNLRAEEIKSRAQEKRIRSMTYGFVGYDINRTIPLVGIDHNIYWRKWRLQANTSITLDDTPSWILGGNLGFKIK